MSAKKFYKMRLTVDESGLMVVNKIFVSVHETPCFYFCIAAHDMGLVSDPIRQPGESKFKCAKRLGTRVYRISKSGSRIAFESEELAFDHLKMLKKKQISHMVRDLEFNRLFLSKCTELDSLNVTYKDTLNTFRSVPDSEELVRQHYVFD